MVWLELPEKMYVFMARGVFGSIYRTLLRRVVHYFSVVFLGPRRGEDWYGISDTCVILFLVWRCRDYVVLLVLRRLSLCRSIIINVAIFVILEGAGEAYND